METFDITEAQLDGLQYQGISEWDSVGHMTLISKLEDAFEIMMDTDDIIDLSSFEIGMDILGKYNIEFKKQYEVS